MQQNNSMKFSCCQKNYVNFQLDVLGEGVGGILKISKDVLCERIDLCVTP